MKRLFTKLALLTLSFLGSVAMADDVVSLPASPDCSSGCDIVYNNHSGNLNLNLNNNDPNAGKKFCITGTFNGSINARNAHIRICGNATITSWSFDQNSSIEITSGATVTVQNSGGINSGCQGFYNWSNQLTFTNGFAPNANFFNYGTMVVSGGDFNMNNPAQYTNHGSISVNNGSYNHNSPNGLNAGSLYAKNDIKLNGGSQMRNECSMIADKEIHVNITFHNYGYAKSGLIMYINGGSSARLYDGAMLSAGSMWLNGNIQGSGNTNGVKIAGNLNSNGGAYVSGTTDLCIGGSFTGAGLINAPASIACTTSIPVTACNPEGMNASSPPPPPSCNVSGSNGGGFTTTITDVVQNCNGTYTITVKVDHNGCGGPTCKTLSHFSVEAIPGSYSNVSVNVLSGGLNYNYVNGPNLGSDPFSGFKLDNTSGIGGGLAGSFTITYTLSSLQDQQFSAKAGTSGQIASFTTTDFTQVMNCNGTTCATPPGVLNGNVYLDQNGDAHVNGTPVYNPASTQLYATLLDASSALVSSVAIANDGTYSFSSLSPGNYSVVLTTALNGTTASLPANWINTGENVGLSGTDGTTNGLVSAAVTSGNTTSNVNFGIRENVGGISGFVYQDTDANTDVNGTPVFNPASTQLYASLFNSSNALVASVAIGNNGAYSFSSVAVGQYSVVLTTTLNGTTATLPLTWINTGENVGLVGNDGTANGVVSASVTAGNTTANVNFGIRENLGGISGLVFNDTDGDSDVDGIAIYNPTNTQLYATLLNNVNALVNSIAIANDGTYSFSGLSAGNYSVIITTILNGTSASLPANWINTGENVGLVGNDGTANGVVSASVTAGNTTSNVNFGIRENLGGISGSVFNDTDGNADVNGTAIYNPASTQLYATLLNSSNALVSSVGIASDGTYSFSGLSAGSYNLVLTTNLNGTTASLPSNWINTGENVGLNGNDGNANGILSVTVSALVTTSQANFGIQEMLSGLTGQVFLDANGLKDNTVNGTGVGAAGGSPLYALVYQTPTAVLQSVQLGADGSFAFNNLNAGNYTVAISQLMASTGQPLPAISLPSAWVFTGENLGNAAGSDGLIDAKLTVTVASGSITTHAHFGIQQLPTATGQTALSQSNPGGNSFVSLPATLFGGNDPDGQVVSIRISAFPSQANALNIDGTAYTSSNFPVQGIVLNTDAQGRPLNIMEIDPVDGDVSVNIPFFAIDNAGFESLLPAQAVVPFATAGGEIVNYYPNFGFNAFAAEDMWPYEGDYDLNDLVIDYQFKIVTSMTNMLKEVEVTFILRAVGAEYRNGFGFQFNSTAFDLNDIQASGSILSENYVNLAANGLEAGQSKPTFILYDNSFNIMPFPGGVGVGINTNPDNPVVAPVTLKATFTFTPNKYHINALNIQNFNPFLIVNQNRGREVHLPHYAPTDLANVALVGSASDDSKPESNRYYVNNKNHPWALNISGTYDYPREQVNILLAYPKFKIWAESGGALYPNWFIDLPGFREGGNIYNIQLDNSGNQGSTGKRNPIDAPSKTPAQRSK